MTSLAKLQTGHQSPTGFLHADTVALIEQLAAEAALDVLAESKRLADVRGLPHRIYLYASNRLRIAQGHLEKRSRSAVAAQTLHSRFLQIVEA